MRGDLVADTPGEARPTLHLPDQAQHLHGTRTRPGHNFMDYSYDRCMNQFTPGQVARMRQRGVLPGGGTRRPSVSGVTVTKDALPASSPSSPEYRVLSAGIFALIVGIAFEFMAVATALPVRRASSAGSGSSRGR